MFLIYLFLSHMIFFINSWSSISSFNFIFFKFLFVSLVINYLTKGLIDFDRFVVKLKNKYIKRKKKSTIESCLLIFNLYLLKCSALLKYCDTDNDFSMKYFSVFTHIILSIVFFFFFFGFREIQFPVIKCRVTLPVIKRKKVKKYYFIGFRGTGLKGINGF